MDKDSIIESAKAHNEFKEFIEKNPDVNIMIKNLDPKEVERIIKETPQLRGLRATEIKEGLISVKAMKTTIGIPENSVKTAYIDPKTGKVVMVL